MEVIIHGSDCKGRWYPSLRVRQTDKTASIDELIKAYQNHYPLVCHVVVSVALPMPEKNRV